MEQNIGHIVAHVKCEIVADCLFDQNRLQSLESSQFLSASWKAFMSRYSTYILSKTNEEYAFQLFPILCLSWRSPRFTKQFPISANISKKIQTKKIVNHLICLLFNHSSSRNLLETRSCSPYKSYNGAEYWALCCSRKMSNSCWLPIWLESTTVSRELPSLIS